MDRPDPRVPAQPAVPDDVPVVDRRVLTAVAATDSIDSTTLAALVGIDVATVRIHLDAAIADGVVAPGAPHVTAENRRMLLATAPRSFTEEVHDRLMERLVDGVRLSPAAATVLIESGCRDPRLARHLLTDATSTPWAERTAVVDLAEAAGADPLEVAAHRAEIAAALGNFDQVLRSSDVVLTHVRHAAVPRAARAAAVAHAHRGTTRLAAETFRFLDDQLLAADVPFAIWAMLGDGDVDARDLLGSLSLDAAPTSTGRGLTLLAQGLMTSIADDAHAALPLLVHASTALLPTSDALVMADSPAALAAIAAIGHGELDTAEQILDAAVAADLGGGIFHARHHLLRAWVEMLRGHLDVAISRVRWALAAGPLSRRDEAMMHAVEVGIARRGSDATELIAAWRRARECLPHLWVDLYSLLVLGELSVAAARMRESFRVEAHLADATTLLQRLGDPPTWAVMFHWYGVHASFAAEEPDLLLPHAEALARASTSSRVAAQLAAVGRTWVRAMANDVDVAEVRDAVAVLEALGLSWDAGRLAARAAASTSDRRDMLDLMQLARSTQRRSSSDPTDSKTPAASHGSHVTEREWEVAQMVLDGLTYRHIGERLFISPKTVEHHVARIRRRIGAEDRQEMLTILRDLSAARQES